MLRAWRLAGHGAGLGWAVCQEAGGQQELQEEESVSPHDAVLHGLPLLWKAKTLKPLRDYKLVIVSSLRDPPRSLKARDAVKQQSPYMASP